MGECIVSIPESDCCCLFVPLLLYFLFVQFSNVKNFHHTFLMNCEAYNVEISYGGCIVYTRIRLLLLICPFISSFFFVCFNQNRSSYFPQELYSVTKLKLGTHGDSELMYRVYWNQAVASYSSLYFSSFFFLCNFQTLKFFATFFSGTVMHRKLKLNAKMKSGSVYRVNWNQAAHTYSSYYFFFFLSFQFSVTNLPFRSSDSAIAGLWSDLLSVLVLF